jgi:hypothetical protein
VIGPVNEFPELDQDADRSDLAEWKKEFARHEADYMRFFRNEAGSSAATSVRWPG